MVALCDTTGAAAQGVNGNNHPTDNSVIDTLFGGNAAADAAFGAGYTVQCFATDIAQGTNNGAVDAGDRVTITVTPTAADTSYYGNDCDHSAATNYEFHFTSMVADGCLSTSKQVNRSWFPGPLEGAGIGANDNCYRSIAKPAPIDKDLEQSIVDIAYKTGGLQSGSLHFNHGTQPQRSYHDGGADGLTLSRDNVQVVANVMPGRELLSAVLHRIETTEANDCPEIMAKIRQDSDFDILDSDDVAEFLACNAIYGFSIAEECVSVLDPRYEHLLDKNGATFTPTAVQIEKAIQQCTNKTQAQCLTHYAAPDTQTRITKRNKDGFSNPFEAPLKVDMAGALTDEEKSNEALTNLAENSCIVNEFRGGMNYNARRLFNMLVPVKTDDDNGDLTVDQGSLSAGRAKVMCNFFEDSGIHNAAHVCKIGTGANSKTRVFMNGKPAEPLYGYDLSTQDPGTLDTATGDNKFEGNAHGVEDPGFPQFGLGLFMMQNGSLPTSALLPRPFTLPSAPRKLTRRTSSGTCSPSRASNLAPPTAE